MKTAEELNITQAELEALLVTRTWLQCEDRPPEARFNMVYSRIHDSCGTACCIGGWMSTFMQAGTFSTEHDETLDYNVVKYVNNRGFLVPGLQELFFPFIIDEEIIYDLDMSSITTRGAVMAIDSFLETGSPEWKRVVDAGEAGLFVSRGRPLRL